MSQSLLTNEEDKFPGNQQGTPVLRQEDIDNFIRSSGLDEATVREVYDNFVDQHPDGKMGKGEFRDMMEMALPSKDARKMEDHIFRLYDTNGDGTIDFKEFMIVYLIMTDGTPEEVLTRIFRVFDVNSDGEISQEELKKLLKDMHGLIKEENAEKASDEMIATTTLAEMDNNEDGKISLEEYIKACLGKKEFTRMLTLKIIDIFGEEEKEEKGEPAE